MFNMNFYLEYLPTVLEDTHVSWHKNLNQQSYLPKLLLYPRYKAIDFAVAAEYLFNVCNA